MGDRCTEFLDQLQEFLDDECAPDMRAKVEAHMLDCPPCGHRADFEERLKAIVATSCRDAAPPGLIDNVMAKLELR